MKTNRQASRLEVALISAYVAVLLVIVVAIGSDALPSRQALTIMAIVLTVPAFDLVTRPIRGVPFNLAYHNKQVPKRRT